MAHIDGRPATPAETNYERREREQREARSRQREAARGAALRGSGALGAAWVEQDQARAHELDDLNAAGREHAERTAKTDPRLAHRQRERDAAASFAEQVAPEFHERRSTTALARDFAATLADKTDDPKETNR